MGNKRNRRSRRVESQSSDRDENTSETSSTQGNATLVGVSENVNNILDRNLGSDKNKNQDDRFYPSEMSELRQSYTPLGIAEDTLDETIIMNENRQERADHHTWTFSSLSKLSQAKSPMRESMQVYTLH